MARIVYHVANFAIRGEASSDETCRLPLLSQAALQMLAAASVCSHLARIASGCSGDSTAGGATVARSRGFTLPTLAATPMRDWRHEMALNNGVDASGTDAAGNTGGDAGALSFDGNAALPVGSDRTRRNSSRS